MENNNGDNPNSNPYRDPIDLSSMANYHYSWKKQRSEQPEPKPSHLNTLNSSGLFQLVSPDKMSVQYSGSQQHGHDVGAVQADCPAPTKRIAYYFEMKVKSAGEKGQVAIGFTGPGYNLRRQPGWEANSIGYHGDDGLLYRGQEKGEPFGSPYSTDDTVGAGINYASQQFFFTKNGNIVGTVVKDIKGPLYPTVAVHSHNEEVIVNFGQQPFAFNIKAYRSEERLKQQQLSEGLTIPHNITRWIVRSYLLHYGYADTLIDFDVESESTSLHNSTSQENGSNQDMDAYELSNRKILRQLIRKGDIDTAFYNLRNWYPQVVQGETSTICFLLHTQRFIEYIRENQSLEAVTYARSTELGKFLKVQPFKGVLEDAFALMAYEKPAESSVGHLLKQCQREFVADAVNAAVLSTYSGANNDVDSCAYSILEKLLRQLTACTLERRALNDNQAEAFDLQREQLRWGWKSADD